MSEPWRTASDLAETLSKVPGFVAKTAERLVVTRRLGTFFREHPDHRALSEAAALDAVRDAEHVLFLCWGNICRSPLAERYLASRLEVAGIEGPTVASAGLGQYDGRPSPADAVEAAGRYDVDLANHRSRITGDDQLDRADAVFVMDTFNYYLLVTRHPEAAGKAFFLRALDPAAGWHEIADPHGEGREAFEEAYGIIVDSVDRLVEATAKSEGPREPEPSDRSGSPDGPGPSDPSGGSDGVATTGEGSERSR